MSVEPGNIALKRIYDDPADDDGCRVLVDRLWPRGVSTERARLDAWLKEIAPSTELRRWFHNGGGFDEFALRYRAELDGNPASVQAVAELRALAAERAPVRVTLLYGARERRDNHARVLAEYLGADLAEPAEAPAQD
ncbi:Uncharacterized conserved protein YeaO, DUF488 family [Cryobacterium psychrotolerans]|uniref:Uncharacterized conserved protein YeaO, DUF488 family n=1 Tax=Cryobacterium psychrotolerans TaxID=386301 RepID=A0A1G8WX92_9MICO|nr:MULTISPECIES: DUF488 family protein [Cryobacterium]TFD49049.1 DUF488 family protein [Cryobacterium sp. TMT1-2-1]TFD85056.1 DUF488 family protein [Cryobacterium psychrotolerans]SDJ82834.1 Uncharacterized conserved protein YeaO, DUF488 family [Cryobacterium psychrotolerans]